MTPSINNGIFYRQTQFDARSHVGKNYLMDMSLEKATDLGPVEFWAMTRKSEMPLYKLSSFGGQNIIEVEGTVARYQVPVSMDDTVEIVADLTTVDKPGRDGQKFEILLSTDRFGYGDILKFDKYSQIEMVVMPEPIRPKGEAFIYTVRLINNDSVKFIDKKYLAPGNRISQYGSVRTPEFSQVFSSWKVSGVGQREYLQYVGTAEAQTEYWISSEANTIGLDPRDFNRITEFVQIDGTGDPAIADLRKYMETTGMTPGALGEMVKQGKARMKFAYAYDDISMRKIARDRENYLMWGSGGIVQFDSPETVAMSSGLWQQIDSGYKHIFNYNNFGLDMFKTVISNYLWPKVDFKEPGSEPVMVVETGRGGMHLANEMIRKEANSNSMIVNALDVNALNTDSKGIASWMGLFYTEVRIPFVAVLRFVYNPALDPVHTNQIENPVLPTGFPLSSYSFIIHDITENGGADNIKLLRRKNSKLRMRIENGMDAHPLSMMMSGNTPVHVGSSRKSGFGAQFWQPYDAIWVKDPTRILKMVMRNPFTGNTL